jgi:hypothetical protein
MSLLALILIVLGLQTDAQAVEPTHRALPADGCTTAQTHALAGPSSCLRSAAVSARSGSRRVTSSRSATGSTHTAREARTKFPYRIMGPVYVIGPEADGSPSGSWIAFFRTDRALPKAICYPCQALYMNGEPAQIFTSDIGDRRRHCYTAQVDVDSFQEGGLRVLPAGSQVRLVLKKGRGPHHPKLQLAATRVGIAVARHPSDQNKPEVERWQRRSGCSPRHPTRTAS